MGRNIDDILKVRNDISPFLIHMTKDKNDHLIASQILHENILGEKVLKQSGSSHSSASYTTPGAGLGREGYKKLFSSICFTEAPLSELHCFFDVASRSVNFKPYGLVFLKDKLKQKGVSPVLYINNFNDDQTDVLRKLCAPFCEDIETASKILPLLQSFGKPLYPMGGGDSSHTHIIDFSWEREWRLPYCYGDLGLLHEDIFIGLCEHENIGEFETKYFSSFSERVPFIDPKRNIKFYSDKISKSIEDSGLNLGQIY